MAEKQTSNEVSAIASKYMRMSRSKFEVEMAFRPTITFEEIQSLAASVLSQDEVKGDR